MSDKNNNDVVNVLGDNDNIPTPNEIRKSYPTPQEGKPKLPAEMMAVDTEDDRRDGSTPANYEDTGNDDEVSDDGKIDLRVDE